MLTLTLPNFISDLVAKNGTTKSSKLRVPATSVADLHTYFTTCHPAAVSRIFEADGSVRKNIILVVNDELVHNSQYSQITFDDGDELALLIQFAGG
ncbi:MoaD/ThiS family protein [Micromonospora sp. NPDC048835]|uniref:MoaD/ThiS family protein n=1 Tax=Micromonospora sp. NPDC048835 TaxID=3155147 RepID=UPI0033E21B79